MDKTRDDHDWPTSPLNSSSNGLSSSSGPFVGLAVTTTVAIPWYWHWLGDEVAGQVVYGLPLWALVSILGSLGVSCFTWWLYQSIWPAEVQELLELANASKSNASQSNASQSGDSQAVTESGNVE